MRCGDLSLTQLFEDNGIKIFAKTDLIIGRHELELEPHARRTFGRKDA